MARKGLVPKKKKHRSEKAAGSPGIKVAVNVARWEPYVSYFIMAVIGAIIIIGPFQRGLFFTTELLPVHIISFALFALWWITRFMAPENEQTQNPMDYCFAALVLLYFLSFLFTAVDKETALAEVLKIANYFVIYLLVYNLCRRDENGLTLKIVLHILLAAGVAVAVGGLGAAAGTWEILGAYEGYRIYTPLQYPNSAAAYLMAAYFLALGLASLSHRWYLRPLYLVPAFLIFITFILTYSRGAWLLMPVLAVLFLAVMATGHRLRALGYMAVSELTTLLLLSRLDAAFRAGASATAWRYILLAAVAVLAAGYLVEFFLRLPARAKAVSAGLLLVLVLVAGALQLGPEIGRPLALERGLDEEPAHQYLEQRVGNIAGGETCSLSLEVNARQEELTAGAKEPEYAWRLVVFGYDLNDERITLIDHREGATNGWEEREFEFLPGEEVQRLEVRVYNYYPGTSVTARNVMLHQKEKEIPLTFALHRFLPHNLYTRLFSIGAGERSVEGRLSFYRDALKIIGDYPLLGTGGGGWAALYRTYQDRDYTTSEVHSHYLQVAVETGIPGLLAFAGIWVFFLLSFVQGRFRSDSDSTTHCLWATICISALALGIHSAIDFNLSLGAVSIFLYTLLATGRSLAEQSTLPFGMRGRGLRLPIPGQPWTTRVTGLLLALVLFFYTWNMWDGHKLGNQAVVLANEGQLEEAIAKLQSAISKDSYRTENYPRLAWLYELAAGMEANKEIAPQLLAEALNFRKRALEIDPYSPKYNQDYGTALIKQGKIEEGLAIIQRLPELHPYNIDSFVVVAQARLAAAEHYFELGQKDAAEKQLQELFALEENMLQYHDDTGPLSFYLGKGHYLAGEYQEAADYLAKVSEGDANYKECLVYLASAYMKMGEEEIAVGVREAFRGEEDLEELYRELLENR